MDTFEQFEQDLRMALGRLYDPTFRPSPLLRAVIGCGDDEPGEVQAALIHAIQAFEPDEQVPPAARSRRLYQILFWRYIQGLTQEEVAERLGLTPRHLRREQERAIGVLAERLLSQSSSVATPKTTYPDAVEIMPEDWRSQVQQEVACLQRSASPSLADVGETLCGVVEHVRALAQKRNVTFKLRAVPSGLGASIHPLALRQVMMVGVTGLLREISGGTVELGAEIDHEQVRVVAEAQPTTIGQLPDDYLIRQLLAAYGGQMAFQTHEGCARFSVNIPRAPKVIVLVLDDNEDLVHFYRRYTAGTAYTIVHAGDARRVFEVIAAVRPQVIVLDIMLPDVDGWELLSQLHEHPETRGLPIVVCSVIREEELALALGATVYVSKPVRRQAFLTALDQAVADAVTGAQSG